jgi:hypothetical protein
VGEPGGQLGALGHQESEVVEAGVAGGGAGSALLDQYEQLTAVRPERRPSRAFLEHGEADGALVVLERAA